MGRSILVVEDDVALLRALCRYLAHAGNRVAGAVNCAEADEALANAAEPVDVVLTDVVLPDGNGFDLAGRIVEGYAGTTVMVMTGDDRLSTAITALHRGVADFLVKPFTFEALDQALERIRPRRPSLVTSAGRTSAPSPTDEWRKKHAPDLMGAAPQLERVFAIIERVSDTNCTVLITGESGTGKELVARALHNASDRKNKPYITVNCAALPENLVESELFGHAKGAFTGAAMSREGRFTAADGGTIFLDEVGELPIGMQAKLLRVLQDGEVMPVGEARSHRVDVRVIAATNRDIEDMVATGAFREDLFHRLNVIPIDLPPLRDRQGDIPLLIEHFIERANVRRGRAITSLSDDALAVLCAYDWPGNVRQLENAIERMVVLRSEGKLTMDDVPQKLHSPTRALQLSAPAAEAPLLPDAGIDLRDAVERFENALILQALERTGWNKNRAAAILRINRTTLVEKLKKKGLEETQAGRAMA